MKKEVLVAVIIGLTMGLIITYGFYRVRTSINAPRTTQEDGNTTESASQVTTLAVHSPENDIVQTETTTTVAGTTIPNAFVVIFVNDQEQITNSDESGNFSIDVELEEGANIISVIVADSEGQTYQQTRTVIVSDLLDEVIETEAASESATMQ